MSKKKSELLKGKFYYIFTTGGLHPSLIFKKSTRNKKITVSPFYSDSYGYDIIKHNKGICVKSKRDFRTHTSLNDWGCFLCIYFD